ncbi:alcohol acetyltransferase [Colletotrichum acutatum]|uniref:Alcohol acetyltransferase n=1 Tax=Glomerella acutata TaxID=27357 RepID=A0AAD8UFB6_GLOAC|nr:alcohol acetyltransferase [Colletotrichum acutatum]KAK1716744.1 alcohol acetyltransferase [Colletotrichum acutatum]
MSSQTEVIRPCGNMEKYSTARHSLGLYRCVAVTGRYVLPPGISTLSQAETILQDAVAQVIAEQPFMQVGIADEDKQTSSFVRVPQINLSNHIQWFPPSHPGSGSGSIPGPDTTGGPGPDATLCKHLSHQHDQLWPEITQRPPWKLSIIPIQTSQNEPPAEIEVIYFFHHAISDGTSGSIFHKRLLHALNNPSTTQHLQSTILTLPTPPSLPLPQENLVNGRISWPYFLRELWSAFGPAWLKPKPAATPWTGEAIRLDTPFHTNVRIVTIPAATVSNLLAACRAKGLTLTPLIHALVAASLARHIPASAAPSFEPSSAISMRRFVQDASLGIDDRMCVLVTSTNHPISETLTTALREPSSSSSPSSGSTLENAIWAVASSVKADLTTRLASLPNDDITAMLRYVDDFHGFFRKKDGKARGDSWEVSNLGAINGRSNNTSNIDDNNNHSQGEGKNDVQDWKLTRAVFSQSAGTVAQAFCVNVAGIAGGETTITVTWNEAVTATEVVEALAGDLEGWTRKLAEGEGL